MKEGLVLFAHGSRDPDWARPFEKIAGEISHKLPRVAIRIAYLEYMRPSLAEAVAALAAAGARSIRVVPLFLGTGGHVKDDLPRLVREAGASHPQLKIILDRPIGEQPALIEAIAGAIAAGVKW